MFLNYIINNVQSSPSFYFKVINPMNYIKAKVYMMFHDSHRNGFTKFLNSDITSIMFLHITFTALKFFLKP